MGGSSDCSRIAKLRCILGGADWGASDYDWVVVVLGEVVEGNW